MKTHWKKQFNYDYLGAYSLAPGKDMILTIKETKKEMVTGTNGQKDQCFVCYFEEDQKPMILNKTNCKQIEALYSPFVEDWPGNKIQLFAKKVKAFGDETEALRIRNKYPDTKLPELTELMPAYEKVVEFMFNGGDISKVKEKYSLTKEMETKLCGTK